MDESPIPRTLAEVEALILELYKPGVAPDTIAKTQDTLQRIQKSPEGWRLAQALLDRSASTPADDQVKFFGALTIIIKLNMESHALSDDDARELLQNLLRWLVVSVHDDSGVLSNPKLCHALVTYFIHFSHLWPNCVRHMLLCLDARQSVPVADADAVDARELASRLDWRSLRVALWFITSLVDNVGRTDIKSIKYMGTHERLIQNAADVSALLGAGLAAQSSDPARAKRLQNESIKALQDWVLYAQRLASNGDVLVSALRALSHRIINCLSDEDLYEAALDFLIDVLFNYPSFFAESDYESLALLFESQWGQERYRQLVEGDFEFESLQFGQLMLAYADAKIQEMIQGNDERLRKLLVALSGLLTAQGYLAAEDRIFERALDFWSTFVETMLDDMYSDPAAMTPWKESLIGLVMQVVGYCWKKIRFPSIEIFMSWDADERSAFGDARKDVGDLLQTVFTIAGRPLVSQFVDLLRQSLATRTWADIEATCFCVSALSDCFADKGEYDDLMRLIFSSELFEVLNLGEAQIPVRLRQTSLSLIERYSDYFERHSEFLPAALNILFDAVKTNPLAGPASKSILTLCSSCRTFLTTEVGAFLQQLYAIPNIDPLAEERIVTAIASIIQAVKDEQARLQLFEQLLAFVRLEAERGLQLRAQQGLGSSDLATNLLLMKGLKQLQLKEGQVPSLDEVMVQTVLVSLRCLAGMARGMQETTDQIDVDAEAASAMPRNEHLVRLQTDIMGIMVGIQAAFPESGEVVDTICSTFKAGFSEIEPGPFVFPAAMVTEYLTRQGPQTPRIGAIVSMAISFSSSLSKGPRDQAVENLEKLLPWVVALLKSMPDPDTNTELTQRGIEFAERVMAQHTAMFMGLQPTSSLEFLFMFALQVLNGKETLPKAAAADFWSRFVMLQSDNAPLQASIQAATEHLGPLLAVSLVQNIAGNALRSELDKLSEPLKKLVAQHVQAQAWLEAALAHPSFPSQQVSGAEKAAFLKKVISLRGGRQTNKIVREFWLACRGSNFAYAS